MLNPSHASGIRQAFEIHSSLKLLILHFDLNPLSTLRCLLQTTPDLRPSLDDILNHSFLRSGGAKRNFDSSRYRLAGTGVPQSRGLSSLYMEPMIQPLVRQPLVSCHSNNYALTSRPDCKALMIERRKGNAFGEEKPHDFRSGGMIGDLAPHGTMRAKERKELTCTPSLRSTGGVSMCVLVINILVF